MIQSVLLGVHLAALLDLVALARRALRSWWRLLAALARLPRFAHPCAPFLFFL
jgi:hypothetical protein